MIPCDPSHRCPKCSATIAVGVGSFSEIGLRWKSPGTSFVEITLFGELLLLFELMRLPKAENCNAGLRALLGPGRLAEFKQDASFLVDRGAG